MIWESTPDAVPAGVTQIGIYDEAMGCRVATVLDDARLLALIEDGPRVLAALMAWQDHMGGWEGAAWRDLESLLQRLGVRR